MSPSLRALLVVPVVAGLAVFASDKALQRLTPLPRTLVEAADALDDYRTADPDTLVLGSSHARSFLTLSKLLAERTGGQQRALPVPLEWGKFSSYRWLLEHRLLPLIDARDGDRRVRDRLRRALLVTEWWDGCESPLPPANLPARAWGLGDFAGDFFRHGLTEFNRKYLQEQWDRAWPRSLLVQDRGHEGIINGVRRRIANDDHDQRELEAAIGEWRRMVDEGVSCPKDKERAALEGILDDFAAEGLEATVILFPRMPTTLTDRAKATTLKDFSSYMSELGRRRGVRVVDLTLVHPLTDADFERDLDHVTPDGNRKLAEWALAGPLAFLSEPAPPRAKVR